MKFFQALKIEGDIKYQILTYIYVKMEAMDCVSNLIKNSKDKNHSAYNVYKLGDIDWPYGVILVEDIVSEKKQVMYKIFDNNILVKDSEGVIGSLCMFDGVFGEEDDLFSAYFSKLIYCVWIKNGEVNLVMNDSLRERDDWFGVITAFRKALVVA